MNGNTIKVTTPRATAPTNDGSNIQWIQQLESTEHCSNKTTTPTKQQLQQNDDSNKTAPPTKRRLQQNGDSNKMATPTKWRLRQTTALINDDFSKMVASKKIMLQKRGIVMKKKKIIYNFKPSK